MELILMIIIFSVIFSKTKRSKQGDYVDAYLEQNKKNPKSEWKTMIPEDQREQLSKGVQEISDAFSNMIGKMSRKKKHQTPEEYRREDNFRRQMEQEERKRRESEEARKRRLEIEKKKKELLKRNEGKNARDAVKAARQAEENKRQSEREARQVQKEAEARFADCTVHSFHDETDSPVENAATPTVAFSLEDYLFPTTASFYPGNEKRETDADFKVEDYLFPTTAPFYPKADIAGQK